MGFWQQGSFCEILHTVIQGVCKSLNKGAAAGGAGFVELHTVYGLVLYLDTFHILSADIQDAVHLRVKEGSGIIVGNSLHFPFIQKKRRLYQCLAVSGGAGVGNPCFPRKVAVNLLDGADTGSQGIAVIVAVEGIEQGTILTDQGCLCCGGTRVNAQITVSAVAGNVSGYDIVVLWRSLNLS